MSIPAEICHGFVTHRDIWSWYNLNDRREGDGPWKASADELATPVPGGTRWTVPAVRRDPAARTPETAALRTAAEKRGMPTVPPARKSPAAISAASGKICPGDGCGSWRKDSSGRIGWTGTHRCWRSGCGSCSGW